MPDWKYYSWNIPPRIKRVFLYVAQYGPVWGFDVYKKLEIPSSSAYYSLKKLREAGCLEAKDDKWGITLKKKQYSLTITGFCHIMILANDEDFNQIITNQKHLMPLVLGKWSIFKGTDLEELAIKKLIESALDHRSHNIYRPDLPDYDLEKTVQNIFTHNFYHPFSKEIKTDDERIEWIQLCSQDSQISTFLIKQLEAVNNYLIQDMSLINDMKKILA